MLTFCHCTYVLLLLWLCELRALDTAQCNTIQWWTDSRWSGAEQSKAGCHSHSTLGLQGLRVFHAPPHHLHIISTPPPALRPLSAHGTFFFCDWSEERVAPRCFWRFGSVLGVETGGDIWYRRKRWDCWRGGEVFFNRPLNSPNTLNLAVTPCEIQATLNHL